MTIKKIDLVNQALSLAGLVSSSNQATSEMTEKGLISLELLMSGLSGKTHINFIPDADTFNPNGNTESGVNPSDASNVVSYIAVNICESLAAPFTNDLKQMSRRAYRKLLTDVPVEKAQAANVPAGQGNIRCGWGYVSPFLYHGDSNENQTTTE